MSFLGGQPVSKIFFMTTTLLNAIICLLAFILLIWNAVRLFYRHNRFYACRVSNIKISQVYIRKPGPKEYTSHFSALFFSSCLVFQTIQFFLLVTGSTRTFRKKWYIKFSYLYWITIALSGFICGVAYAFTPKPDVVAVGFLVFFSASSAVISLICMQRSQNKENFMRGHSGYEARILQSGSNTDSTTIQENLQFTDDPSINRTEQPLRLQRGRRCSRLCFNFWKILNRFLKVIHWAFSVLFIAGAITLALSYRFSNP